MTTKIEWTNETWNIITGCSHASEGCQNCYAEKMHKRLTAMGQAKYSKPFTEVVFHPEELERVNSFKKGSFVFVNSMSDTFHPDVERSWIKDILIACAARRHEVHFQILTKRAERLSEFVYPSNVWLGVTVEKAKYLRRIEHLKYTDAKIKFLSCEPLLEDLGELDLTGIDWVICGGESGSKARPMHVEWVRNIQRQCQEQRVPFFFKQWGEWKPEFDDEFKFCEMMNPKNEGKFMLSNGKLFRRVGKSKSGALLDGVEYKQFPNIFDKSKPFWIIQRED